MATPLKINNAGGTEVKQFTTAEENYIAYQIGLHLAADSANGDGTITSNSAHTSIGSYTNTFFNEAVGTHPSTSITSGSTTTTVYQNQTSAIETDSDIEIPLMWIDSGGQTGFKQMTTADLNTAVDRYLSTIFTNDYPGTFKLASSSPGPDYSVHLSSVFTDTRTDGTSIAYNIYRRDSYTAPTAVRPLYVRDNGGFDGIQAMNDRQIKYSFGQRAKTRIGASKIGTYQLRTSAQGAPTDPGTWVAAGAATDTKQTTADIVYLRDSTTNFAAQYTKNYTQQYTVEYVEPYLADYTNTFTTNYERFYAQGYIAQYLLVNNDQGPGSPNYSGPLPYNAGPAPAPTASYTGQFPYASADIYVGPPRSVYYIEGDAINVYYTASTLYYVNVEYTTTAIYTNSAFQAPGPNEFYTGPGFYNPGFNTTYIHNSFQPPYTAQEIYLKGLYNDYGQQVIQYGRARQYLGSLLYTSQSGFTEPGANDPTPFHITGYQRQFLQPIPYVPDDTFYQNAYTDTYTTLYNKQYTRGYDATNLYIGPGGTYTSYEKTYNSTFVGNLFYDRNFTGQYQPPLYSKGYTGTVIQKRLYYTFRYETSAVFPYTANTGYNGVAVSSSFYSRTVFYRTATATFFQGSAPPGPTFANYSNPQRYTRTLNFPAFYVRAVTYSGGATGAFVGYIAQYSRDYTEQVGYIKAYLVGTATLQYARDYGIPGGLNTNTVYYSVGGYTGIQTVNYTTTAQYVSQYEITFSRTYDQLYNAQYDTTAFVANYTGSSPTSPNYTLSYVNFFDPPKYTVNYIPEYNSGFSVQNYISFYDATYLVPYENIYTSVFQNAYLSNYTREFINFFDAQYQQDYIGNFEGNFAGETIQATSQTEETYTLYVRIG